MTPNTLIPTALGSIWTPPGTTAACFLMLLCSAAAGQVVGTAGPEARSTVLYVAAGGNDGWSGKLPMANPDKTDGPFASLRGARDALRELRRKQALKHPVTVMVRGGKHYLDETLVLTSEDGGTREFPIVYRAYPGEISERQPE